MLNKFFHFFIIIFQKLYFVIILLYFQIYNELIYLNIFFQFLFF